MELSMTATDAGSRCAESNQACKLWGAAAGSPAPAGRRRRDRLSTGPCTCCQPGLGHPPCQGLLLWRAVLSTAQAAAGVLTS